MIPQIPFKMEDVEKLSDEERDRFDGAILFFIARLPKIISHDPALRNRWNTYRSFLKHDANKKLFDKITNDLKELTSFRKKIGVDRERTLSEAIGLNHV